MKSLFAALVVGTLVAAGTCTLVGCGSNASTSEKMGAADHMGDAKMDGTAMANNKMANGKMDDGKMAAEAPMNDAMQPAKMAGAKMDSDKMGDQ